jgi:hypothetical protein
MFNHNGFFLIEKKNWGNFLCPPRKFVAPQGLNIIREKNLCLSFNIFEKKIKGKFLVGPPPQLLSFKSKTQPSQQVFFSHP